MSAGQSVQVEKRGDIAIITLSRPENLNAMSYKDWILLTSTLRELDKADHKITLVTGQGRFFSSGANVRDRYVNRPNSAGDPDRARYLQSLGSLNVDLARALYQHSKLLIAALNGPAIGLAAAMLGHFDFIYAVESAYVSTPFSAIGIVAEAASSLTFVQRMGMGRAKEALILGKKQTSADLLTCGFVNRVFSDQSQPAFTETVIAHINDQFGDLDLDAAIRCRELIRAPSALQMDAANLREIMNAVDRYETGSPEQRFADIGVLFRFGASLIALRSTIANKKRRHKL